MRRLAGTTERSIEPFLLPFAVLIALLLGVAVSNSLVIVFLTMAAVMVILFTLLGRRAEKVFLTSLVVLLAGYYVQGRGFAYFGFPPLYVGEIVLLLGSTAVAFGRLRWRFAPVQLLLVLFMAIGLARTIPFIGTYGIYALRDASLWYYALFALLVSMLLTVDRLHSTLRLFAMFLPTAIVALALMTVFFRSIPSTLPHYPGSPLTIVSVMKPGDRAVVLVALAAFVLTGLYKFYSVRQIPQPLFWSLWLVSAFLVAIQNRGGLLAMGVALLIVAILNPSRQWVVLGVAGSFIIVFLVTLSPKIETGGRSISIAQVRENTVSIFSDDTENVGRIQGTKDWRLELWSHIYDDTVHGPYFWTGQGFGINLVSEYGAGVTKDNEVRAPHNTHVSVLARMGVPGAIVWILLQGSLLFGLLSTWLKAKQMKNDSQAMVCVWLLAIWVAAMVNTSFDAYLEGPQGSIPFWCTFGAGVAMVRIQHEEHQVLSQEKTR